MEAGWKETRKSYGNEHIAYRSGITAGAPRELSG